MEQIEYIQNFIRQIDDILKYKNQDAAENLQGKIIAALKNDIDKLEDGLSYNMLDFYSDEDRYLSRANYINNLELLKCKLEFYVAKLKSENRKPIIDKKSETVFNITNTNTNTNTNTLDFNVAFDEARKAIEDNESLEDKQIEEIKDKIIELETIFNSKESKKDKWSKCREIFLWISNKGVAVATVIVPLIAKCLQSK